MDSLSPSFSIIIPTYNRAKFLPATIASALQQTYPAIEVIVVDDGSTDDTEDVMDLLSNKVVKYVKIENGERGAARNHGCSLAVGDYLYFLDSDDILYNNHLEEALNFISANSNPEWIFQHYEFRTELGTLKPINYDFRNPIKYLVCQGNFMSCHGVFLRKDIARQHPFIENRAMAGSEDYALWLSLAARFPLLINPITTSALVQHDGRSVFNFSSKALITRKVTMLRYVLSDTQITAAFKPWLPQLRSNTHSYIALHCAMTGHKRLALRHSGEAFLAYPSFIFNRRLLSICKIILLR